MNGYGGEIKVRDLNGYLSPTWSRAGEREREKINWLSGRYSGENILPLEDKKHIFVC